MDAQRNLLFVATPAAALLLLLTGCNSEMVCGPGTVQVGNACIVDDSTGGGGGTDGTGGGDSDAGTGGPADMMADASGGGGGGGGGGGTGGGDYSPDPPGGGGGGGGGGGDGGCDAASGECDAWEEAIAAGLVDRQMAAGCGRAMEHEERIDGVAERHADHQASVDMLTSDSPDGNLFDQVGDAGLEFRDVAALFSVTYDSPEDVLTRWDANADAADILTRCDHVIGVGVATGESGDSYVTVLLARL